MKLIVGLGNPGIEYQFTPHNLGFLAIDRIADDCGVEVRNRQCRALTARVTIGAEQVILAKPETYMNLSGIAVRELLTKHDLNPATDLIVIYDELDLPLGTIRIRQRIRLGVTPDAKKVLEGARYLLKPLRKTQLKIVDEVLDRAAEALKVILTEGAATAMNRFNRKVEAES